MTGLIGGREAHDRELVLLGVAFVTMTLGLGATAGLMAAAALVTGLSGAGWVMPSPAAWPRGLIGVLAHPERPGAALGQPWAGALAEHATSYWTTAVLLLVAIAAGAAIGGRAWWRWAGPTPPGHASRADIRAELSVQAARRRARFTRPTMSEAQRRKAPLTEVGSPMHSGPIGPLCVPFENPTGTLAPTQSGKSRRALVHQALGTPGALLCSTTKPDLFELTALARTRRPGTGPVVVFDTTGTVRWPARLRWSLVEGCDNPSTAIRRATAMVEAGAIGLRGVSGNDKVFRDRAKVVLAAYLLAAALAGRGIDTVLSWVLSRAGKPAEILEGRYPQIAENLRRESGMVAETADAVWMSVRRVMEPLLDPTLLDLCSPRPGEGFDARAFIATGGSLYLVAGETQAGAATPILTALAEHWIETAREMALRTPHRRLDPPATAVLDELTNATPLPELPAQVSDSAGRGVVVHWAAQSRAALQDAYGRNGAALLIENTTAMSIWGGGKDRDTLEWVSALSGHYDRRRYQLHTDGILSPGRTAIGTETVPVYRPGDVRRLPRNQVLIIHRGLGVIRATTRDVSERPDWPQLRADLESIRQGTPAVTAAGLRTDTTGPMRAALIDDPPTAPITLPAPW